MTSFEELKKNRETKHYDSPEHWRARAAELFGDDFKKWRFRCPCCGHVQTFQDFIDIGVVKEEAGTVFYFSCIGRWMPNHDPGEFGSKSPCNYTCGGLFRLGDFVKNDVGTETCVLWFDEE